MVLTGYVGLLFGVLYVASGSLLLPVVLHALIDARFALIPARREACAPAGAALPARAG